MNIQQKPENRILNILHWIFSVLFFNIQYSIPNNEYPTQTWKLEIEYSTLDIFGFVFLISNIQYPIMNIQHKLGNWKLNILHWIFAVLFFNIQYSIPNNEYPTQT